jgi:hypothetical protein
MTDQPSKPSFAPGMTMPVVAGEEYTLKDAKGDSLILEGRDDPLTLEFANAFDTYLLIRAVYEAEHEQSKLAWQECLDKYEALPQRIKDTFSPTKGISLPTRPL